MSRLQVSKALYCASSVADEASNTEAGPGGYAEGTSDSCSLRQVRQI